MRRRARAYSSSCYSWLHSLLQALMYLGNWLSNVPPNSSNKPCMHASHKSGVRHYFAQCILLVLIPIHIKFWQRIWGQKFTQQMKYVELRSFQLAVQISYNISGADPEIFFGALWPWVGGYMYFTQLISLYWTMWGGGGWQTLIDLFPYIVSYTNEQVKGGWLATNFHLWVWYNNHYAYLVLLFMMNSVDMKWMYDKLG